MGTKVYNADEVTLNIAGFLIDSGYADGEFLRVERESDSFTDVVGTDGEVAVSKTKDRRATITVILMQTSDANDVLSALHNLAENSPGLAGAGPLYIRDRQGRTILESDTCWIAKPPDAAFDRSAGPREWKVRASQLEGTHGGNTSTV